MDAKIYITSIESFEHVLFGMAYPPSVCVGFICISDSSIASYLLHHCASVLLPEV
jgi:hypothetical protein